jgi:hypothetical protein
MRKRVEHGASCTDQLGRDVLQRRTDHHETVETETDPHLSTQSRQSGPEPPPQRLRGLASAARCGHTRGGTTARMATFRPAQPHSRLNSPSPPPHAPPKLARPTGSSVQRLGQPLDALISSRGNTMPAASSTRAAYHRYPRSACLTPFATPFRRNRLSTSAPAAGDRRNGGACAKKNNLLTCLWTERRSARRSRRTFCGPIRTSHWGDSQHRARCLAPLPSLMRPLTPLFFCRFRMLEPCSQLLA